MSPKICASTRKRSLGRCSRWVRRARPTTRALALPSDHDLRQRGGGGRDLHPRRRLPRGDFAAKVNVGIGRHQCADPGYRSPTIPLAAVKEVGLFGDPQSARARIPSSPFYTKTKTITSRWAVRPSRRAAEFSIPTMKLARDSRTRRAAGFAAKVGTGFFRKDHAQIDKARCKVRPQRGPDLRFAIWAREFAAGKKKIAPTLRSAGTRRSIFPVDVMREGGDARHRRRLYPR